MRTVPDPVSVTHGTVPRSRRAHALDMLNTTTEQPGSIPSGTDLEALRAAFAGDVLAPADEVFSGEM